MLASRPPAAMARRASSAPSIAEETAIQQDAPDAVPKRDLECGTLHKLCLRRNGARTVRDEIQLGVGDAAHVCQPFQPNALRGRRLIRR